MTSVCPGLGDDPQGYLSFVLDLIWRFDVLLPIHEQGFLFAKVPEQILSHVAVALPSFESYARAHNKVGFSRLASELNLPQPTTQFVSTAEELHRIETLPYVLKGAVGTASRSIWLINNREDLQAAIHDLERNRGFAEPVLVQELERGYIEHAQAVFHEEHSSPSMAIVNSAVALGVVTPPRSAYFAQLFVPIWPAWGSIYSGMAPYRLTTFCKARSRFTSTVIPDLSSR